MKEPYKIDIDETIPPVIHPPRNFALVLKEKPKETLDAMEANGIIKKVDKPTTWFNNSLRICIDPKDLNKAIKREHCHLPTLDEIAPKLKDNKLFSKLHASNALEYSIRPS